MPHTNYKGYQLRTRVFWGFLVVSLLTMFASSLLSFIILKNNAIEQSRTEMQKDNNALMASLDYAVSRTTIKTDEISTVLKNKILEIADVNKHDILIYDLNGKFLISNKDASLVKTKFIPKDILKKVISTDSRVDTQEYDAQMDATKTSSYSILKNNTLDPIGVVYLPYYHDDSIYLSVLNRYLKYMILVNIVILLFSIWLSWIISNNLTKALSRFSEMISRVTLFEKDMQPIRYYHNDELSALVKSYNKMILQIQEQRERLSFIEKEEAWREMAKQVAHEVKNPLTPMKLTIQNFDRKFDPNDPDIAEKVKKMSQSMVSQIDLISKVATAFSQFAQLPKRNDEVLNLNNELHNILRIFNDDKIFVHANKENIIIQMDKIYLSRIITNLVKNALQAIDDEKKFIINVDVEQVNKRINILVEDNGIGIAEEMKSRIFEPNFTSKNTGMGLGLTMVRKMIEEYQGTITFKSEVGIGTTFFISLPSNV